MGYKAASIFVNEGEPGYFGQLPPHDPEKAQSICRSLGLAYSTVKQSTFEDGLWPPERTFALGAYEKGMILADRDTLSTCSYENDDPMVLKILRNYPGATVLCVTLHSVVDHWGYSLYENSKLVRRFVGDADNGIALDEGELQPEEKGLFAGSRVTEPGRRMFRVDLDGISEGEPEHVVGEELVFLMASRFFGQRLDYDRPVDLFKLQLGLFTKPSPWWKLWQQAR